MSDLLEIQAVETDEGIFISNKQRWSSNICIFYFDGVNPSTTHCERWSKIDKPFKKVEKHLGYKNENHRYELKDPEMESDKFPKEIKGEDIYYDEDEYGWYLSGKYSHLSSLYSLKYDEIDLGFEEIKFTYEVVYKIDRLNSKDRYKGQQYPQNLLIDKITTPEIVHHTLPSFLSDEDSYRIIRQHVKNNIDPKVARVTSDYDFCLTVSKAIPLAGHQEYQVDVNWNPFGKRKRQPKYEKRIRTEKNVEIYKVAPKTRDGYPVVRKFSGKNHKELQENIDKFLDGLMKFINEPVKECSKCKGLGTVVNTEFKSNA